MVDSVMFKGNAYRIFLAEYERHVSEALSEVGEGLALNGEVCKKLSARFHTIKGGSGFFGFKEVAEHSAFLERFFQQQLEAIHSGIPEALRRIKRLGELRAEMPPHGG